MQARRKKCQAKGKDAVDEQRSGRPTEINLSESMRVTECNQTLATRREVASKLSELRFRKNIINLSQVFVYLSCY